MSVQINPASILQELLRQRPAPTETNTKTQDVQNTFRSADRNRDNVLSKDELASHSQNLGTMIKLIGMFSAFAPNSQWKGLQDKLQTQLNSANLMQTNYDAFANAGRVNGALLDTSLDASRPVNGTFCFENIANLASRDGNATDISRTDLRGPVSYPPELPPVIPPPVSPPPPPPVPPQPEGRTTAKGYIEHLYRTVLDREGEAAGVAGHSSHLAATGAAGVPDRIKAFFNSEEYKSKNKSSEETVKDLYQGILGREAEAGGLAGWTAHLQGGMDINTMIDHFVGSAEYQTQIQNKQVFNG